MSPQELYDQHGMGTSKEFVALTMNGLREHIDRIAEICKTVHNLHPDSILDAPCATGLITALVSYYLDGPKRVVGLDISPSYCEIANRIYGIQTICKDIRDYRPDEKFDLVMGLEILEHVDDPESIVRAFVRCSKKYVLLSTPEEQGEVDGTYHVRYVSVDQLSGWAFDAGLRRVRTWFLRSEFCEKPKWMGWNFLLGEVIGA